MTSSSRQIQMIVDSIQVDALPGLFNAVYRMIDPEQPSPECIQAAENGFADAATAEQVWDTALDLAACLRTAPLFELPDEPEPPHEPEPPDEKEPADSTHTAADLILAALIVRLHAQTDRRSKNAPDADID